MAYKDLREYLDVLEKNGKLFRVRKPVEKGWEIGGLGRWVLQGLPEEKRFGLLFENIKDRPGAAVASLVTGPSRDMVALAMGCKAEEIYDKWIGAMDHLIPPREVRRDQAPVKEVVVKDIDLDKLPIPVTTPGRDSGPYLTATLTITQDPGDRNYNIGLYRFELTGKDIMGTWFAPGSGMGLHYYRGYEDRNQSMPVAIALGGDPSLILASMGKFPYGVSEYGVAGGLRGEAVEVVKAETSDLLVPAWAEYVIEGEIPPHERADEGPFGEYTGFMGSRGPRPFMKVKCITHRKNPILHNMVTGVPPSEGPIARGQVWGAMLYKALQYDLKEPGIMDVHFTVGSGSWGHAIVQMQPKYAGHSKKIAVITSHLLEATAPKIVTVVNDDIDIRDPLAVEWAMNFRVNPSHDITILDHCAAPNLDPSSGLKHDTPFEQRMIGSKMIVDATIQSTYPEISMPSRDFMERALTPWKECGLPEFKVPKGTALLLEKHPHAGDKMKPFF